MTGGGKGGGITAKSVQILGGTTWWTATLPFGLVEGRGWRKRGEGELLV